MSSNLSDHRLERRPRWGPGIDIQVAAPEKPAAVLHGSQGGEAYDGPDVVADGRVRRLEQPEHGAGEGQRRGDGGAGAKAGSDLFSHCLRDRCNKPACLGCT